MEGLLFAPVNEYILKHKAKRKPNVPWITKELNVLCRKKKSLYKKAKRNKKEQNWINYRKLNNMLKKECNSMGTYQQLSGRTRRK